MKRLWVAIFLLSFTMIFCIFEFAYVNFKTEKFNDKLEKVSVYISDKEYRNAYNLCSNILNEWENCEKKLNAFLLHSEVDSVTQSIAELRQTTLCKNDTDFLIQYEKTKRQLLSLKESELPNFENIL